MKSLTKVLGGGAIVTENRDNTGPEDLQGGDVGWEDAEWTRERGYIHLFNTGLFKEHLRGRDTRVQWNGDSVSNTWWQTSASFGVELSTAQ